MRKFEFAGFLAARLARRTETSKSLLQERVSTVYQSTSEWFMSTATVHVATFWSKYYLHEELCHGETIDIHHLS